MFIQSKDEKHLVVLSRGEKLVESLTKVSHELDLAGGLITGIGAMEHLHLGYYDLGTKTYTEKTFDQGEFELLQVTGNVSLKDGEVYVHVHGTFSDSEFRAFGGHIFEAVTAVTCELYITPLGEMPTRSLDENVGLHTICGIR